MIILALKLKAIPHVRDLVQHSTYCRAGFGGTPTTDSRIAVLSSRTGTNSEIRNDNLQVTVVGNCEKIK